MEDLYPTIKEIHSFLRWIVLAAVIIVVVKYLVSWLSGNKFSQLDNRISLISIISLDIQLLLGLILYFFLSPFTKDIFNTGFSMQDAQSRFYAIEHPVSMLLAIVFAHVGRTLMKKSTNDRMKFKRGTVWFALSLIFMLARMPW